MRRSIRRIDICHRQKSAEVHYWDVCEIAELDDKVAQTQRDYISAVAIGEELCAIDGSISMQDMFRVKFPDAKA